jgi:hypothetical protein
MAARVVSPHRLVVEGIPEGIAALRRDSALEIRMYGDRITYKRNRRRLMEVMHALKGVDSCAAKGPPPLGCMVGVNPRRVVRAGGAVFPVPAGWTAAVQRVVP